ARSHPETARSGRAGHPHHPHAARCLRGRRPSDRHAPRTEGDREENERDQHAGARPVHGRRARRYAAMSAIYPRLYPRVAGRPSIPGFTMAVNGVKDMSAARTRAREHDQGVTRMKTLRSFAFWGVSLACLAVPLAVASAGEKPWYPFPVQVWDPPFN